MWRNHRRDPTTRAEPPGFSDFQLIARGATGDVLRARQAGMGRTVALKIYTAAGGADCAERELAVAGWLGVHPHLVTVHGRGRAPSGHSYVIMPWYEGGSLDEEVRRRGPLPLPEALSLAVKLAGALGYLHSRGVVHRDVKPGNVLLTATGEPVLADYDLATLPGEAQLPAAGLTPLHAAPEVLRGEISTPRSDVWSLVSTLCTILDRSNLPPALSDLLSTATSADAAVRPADGGALAAWLQRAQDLLGLPVTQVPPIPTRPVVVPPIAPIPAAPAEPEEPVMTVPEEPEGPEVPEKPVVSAPPVLPVSPRSPVPPRGTAAPRPVVVRPRRPTPSAGPRRITVLGRAPVPGLSPILGPPLMLGALAGIAHTSGFFRERTPRETGDGPRPASSGATATVLRDPVTAARSSGPAIVAGALAGTALALLVLAVATCLQLY